MLDHVLYVMTPVNGDGKIMSGKLLKLNSIFEHLGNVLTARTKWHPERAVGIIEVTMKCLLLERDLQHGWWRHCAEAAKFLLNRFPVLSQLSTIPTDGDQVRPIEVLTDGLQS